MRNSYPNCCLGTVFCIPKGIQGIRIAKRSSWRLFREETKYLTATAKPTIGSLELLNGGYTQTNKDTLKFLMDTHFPGNMEIKGENEEPPHTLKPLRQDWYVASQVVTNQKLEWTINSFSKYKSPGSDGLFPALLQEGLEIMLEYVVALPRTCLAVGYLPQTWRMVKAVFIPKPGKVTTTKPKAF